MTKKIILFCFLCCPLIVRSQNNTISEKAQIKTALQAAPESYRSDAKVLGYNEKDKLVTLQEGTGHLVCLADDPDNKGINVACYSDKLEPFMARGRQLSAEGKTESEKREIRKEEIENGELEMPEEPAALYVLTGKEEDYNPQTGELKNSRLRYVLYKPYMTAEETGLPTKPQMEGMPWLMDAGTQRSHVMITPAKN